MWGHLNECPGGDMEGNIRQYSSPSGARLGVSQALTSFPFSFITLLLTFPILSIQVRSSDSIASTGPHHIRKNCKQEKKNTKLSQTSLFLATLWSQAWCRTDQVKMSSPLLLTNTQTANLNMETHMKRFV